MRSQLARRVCVLICLLAPTSHASSSQDSAPYEPPLPGNLIVPNVLRPLVQRMWRKSPTFRRQCARLTEHTEVTVHIELSTLTRKVKAQSRVRPYAGGHYAAVQIDARTPQLHVEHIAHELEHVLEQVDGTDLPRLARRRVDGVIGSDSGYETARAQSVGLTVAREMLW